MKKLLLVLIVPLLFTCNDISNKQERQKKHKIEQVRPFKVGDIVYHKLDSTQCIVTCVNNSRSIDVEYRLANGQMESDCCEKEDLYFKKY